MDIRQPSITGRTIMAMPMRSMLRIPLLLPPRG